MPRISNMLSKNDIDKNIEIIHNKIDHSKSKHIGNNHYYQHYNNQNHIYYHHDGKNFKETSVIMNDGTHKLTSKGKNGNTNHIKDFIYHHVNTHGKVKSDDVNTEGSKKLWKEIAKQHPDNMKLYHVNTKTGEEHHATQEHLDKHENEIWNINSSAESHKLELRKNEK